MSLLRIVQPLLHWFWKFWGFGGCLGCWFFFFILSSIVLLGIYCFFNPYKKSNMILFLFSTLFCFLFHWILILFLLFILLILILVVLRVIWKDISIPFSFKSIQKIQLEKNVPNNWYEQKFAQYHKASKNTL